MCCVCEYLKYCVVMAANFGRVSAMRNPVPDYMTVAAIALGAAAALAAQSADVAERARALHARSLVFDGHVHAVDRVFYHGRDIGERKSDGQFDPPRAK